MIALWLDTRIGLIGLTIIHVLADYPAYRVKNVESSNMY